MYCNPNNKLLVFKKFVACKCIEETFFDGTVTEEPGGLQSMGLQRVVHDWITEHVCMLHHYSRYFCHIKNNSLTCPQIFLSLLFQKHIDCWNWNRFVHYKHNLGFKQILINLSRPGQREKHTRKNMAGGHCKAFYSRISLWTLRKCSLWFNSYTELFLFNN